MVILFGVDDGLSYDQRIMNGTLNPIGQSRVSSPARIDSFLAINASLLAPAIAQHVVLKATRRCCAQRLLH